MLNKCILMGRLTKEPEIRYTQGAEPIAVARFNLAVDRNYQTNGNKVTDFFEIEAWRQRAEFAEKYLSKGQLICVEGSFQRHQWEDKSGNKRYDYKLQADNFYFAEGKKSNTEQNNRAENATSAPADFDPLAGSAGSGFDPYDDEFVIIDENISDEDLPF